MVATQGFSTRCVQAGQEVPETANRARAVPIYATSSYVFKNSKHGADLFGLREPGYMYSRLVNPTTDVFEKRIAALEGGSAALATSSGMSAQTLALLGVASPGDNIVSSSFLYGGTYNAFKNFSQWFNIDVKFAEGDDVASIEKLIDDKTKGVYIESIGNPKYNVPDFEAIVKFAHSKGVPVIVDNTFGAGGYFCTPFDFGVDIITHSATKWIDGHGNSIGGIIVYKDITKDNGFEFSDYPEKYPQFSTPCSSYHGAVLNDMFGKLAFISYARVVLMRDLGPVMSPFNAFLMLTGLETLALRGKQHGDNALKLAKWLQKSKYVSFVSYPGLDDHPYHENAEKYLHNGYGAVLSFGVKDVPNPSDDPFKEAGPLTVDNLKIWSNLANVGDSKSLIINPWTTTHEQLSPEEKEASGVTKGLLRASVGIEDVDDLIADLEQAFKKVFKD